MKLGLGLYGLQSTRKSENNFALILYVTDSCLMLLEGELESAIGTMLRNETLWNLNLEKNEIQHLIGDRIMEK